MKTAFLLPIILFLTACSTQSAMPLGNNMMQIDVSAPPVVGRAGAQKLAFEKAAQATIENGYDKFIVAGSKGWTEAVGGGGSYGQFSANSMSADGSYQSGWNISRKAEVSMVIKMFHYKDKGAADAVDAHQVLKAKK